MTSIDSINKTVFHKQRCFRLIPSHFPPIHLFEDVASPEEFDALFAVQMLTNPRIQDDIGFLDIVPKEQRLFGVPGCGYVMAAFTHINPNGSRFSNGDYGVYYAADSVKTAIAETVYHKEKFLSYTNEPPQELAMRSLIADFSANLFDIRPLDQLNPIYSLTEYHAGQRLGAQIKEQQEDGVVYHSVRASGVNFALFKPINIHQCIQGAHYSYVWDGNKIAGIYQKVATEYSTG
jgi:hypothetical protein